MVSVHRSNARVINEHELERALRESVQGPSRCVPPETLNEANVDCFYGENQTERSMNSELSMLCAGNIVALFNLVRVDCSYGE